MTLQTLGCIFIAIGILAVIVVMIGVVWIWPRGEGVDWQEESEVNSCLPRQAYRPGPGWQYLGPAVYEHRSGVRIHTCGMARLPGGETVWGNAYPMSAVLRRFVRATGGNTKRGTMAWALQLDAGTLPVG